MIMDYTTLKVGDIVAIASSGSWRIFEHGHYRVIKVNKVKVVVERVSDGYVRNFSVRKHVEIGGGGYYQSFLETVDEQAARIAAREKEAAIRASWETVEQAARDKNFAALQQAMANLESMLDPVPF